MFDFTPPHAAQARLVVEKLQTAGFTAYLAGGCVRDTILGRTPKDFDVATDATPDKVREIFGHSRTLSFGASFGVIGVLGKATTPTEVATFRSDGEYSDGRRPDSVRFGSAEQDAIRRDFTINGMFYDPVAFQVIDFVAGQEDLKRGIIRAIGDPATRIGEDKLRMLRALRFAASLGFVLDPQTQAAIHQFAAQVTVVSGERVGAEMRRMLGAKGATNAFQLLFDTDLMQYVWPSVARLADDQMISDAKQLLSKMNPGSFEVAVAAIIARMGIDVDKSLDELTSNWKLSGDEQRAISESVRHRETIVRADVLPWSVVQPIVSARDAESIIDTARAWVSAFDEPDAGVKFCMSRQTWSREQLDPPPLLTGDTLRQLGYKPGPKFREVLQSIRDQQLNQQISTQAEAIMCAESLLVERHG